MRVKKILVAQPAPSSDKSPFTELISKHKISVDFRPFIAVEGVSLKEFRAQRVDVLAHTAVIFTSRKTVDHFFRLCEEARLTVPETMKYFCVTEAIALYLQKYIVYRKRKIFYGAGTFSELLDVIAKHKDEKFLVALSEPHKPEIPQQLARLGVKHTKAILTRTIPQNLLDVRLNDYHLVACYSSADVRALQHNFPSLPDGLIVAALGASTAQEAQDKGIPVDVMAPTPHFPSLTMAIDHFLTALHAGESVDSFKYVRPEPAPEPLKKGTARSSSRPSAAAKSAPKISAASKATAASKGASAPKAVAKPKAAAVAPKPKAAPKSATPLKPAAASKPAAAGKSIVKSAAPQAASTRAKKAGK